VSLRCDGYPPFVFAFGRAARLHKPFAVKPGVASRELIGEVCG